MLTKKHEKIELSDTYWRRINMRSVANLLGAEMIHNLYNRYWPPINSIRFRNTLTNFKDGEVQSYAPHKEWELLQKLVGQKFIEEDAILISEIRKIMQPKYVLTRGLIERANKANLSSLSDMELALLLVDIMEVPLGEIYKLNVVQIEYGLNYALNQILSEIEPDENERNYLLSQLISPNELTVAQQEEVEFNRRIVELRKKDVKIDSDEAIESIKVHHAEYAGNHCAYGEVPPSLDSYLEKAQHMHEKEELLLESDARKIVEKQHMQSQKILEKIGDQRLKRLCNLMADIGVFRDKNKAMLGQTIPPRLSLMDEVAKRNSDIVSRDELDMYLQSEIVQLILNKNILDSVELENRRNGVSIVRAEALQSSYIPVSATVKREEEVKGICASPGQYEGTVKVIHDSSDLEKMNNGDVMVAIGTDFDLIEIMHLAGAIITEEGGLLSHASVVSRELEKPCLIGVVNATKIFNDGERVNVDATSGHIQVIGN